MIPMHSARGTAISAAKIARKNVLWSNEFADLTFDATASARIGCSEIALRYVADPLEVTNNGRPIKSQFPVERLNCLWCGGLSKYRLSKSSRQHLKCGEYDDRYYE